MSQNGPAKRLGVATFLPDYPENVVIVDRTAAAILDVDMRDLALADRVPQIVVGLCRAAAAQSRVIAALSSVGLSSAAAPNRRLFLEVAIRLIWMASLSREDRRQATDIMLEADRRDTMATLDYLNGLGHEVDFDPSEMNSFELQAPTKGALQEQTRKLAAAVRQGDAEPWALYAMWREETKNSHPSGTIAGQYAPTFDGTHLSSGHPDPMDPDLEAHRLTQVLIVRATEQILSDEGYEPAVASRIVDAFEASCP